MNPVESAVPKPTIEEALSTIEVLEREITKVIVGQPTLIRRLLTALFAVDSVLRAPQRARARAAATCCSRACRASPRR